MDSQILNLELCSTDSKVRPSHEMPGREPDTAVGANGTDEPTYVRVPEPRCVAGVRGAWRAQTTIVPWTFRLAPGARRGSAIPALRRDGRYGLRSPGRAPDADGATEKLLHPWIVSWTSEKMKRNRRDQLPESNLPTLVPGRCSLERSKQTRPEPARPYVAELPGKWPGSVAAPVRAVVCVGGTAGGRARQHSWAGSEYFFSWLCRPRPPPTSASPCRGDTVARGVCPPMRRACRPFSAVPLYP
jgi:hypothetical protein